MNPLIIPPRPKRNKIDEVMRSIPPLEKAPEKIGERKIVYRREEELKYISDEQESKRTWKFFVACLLLLFGLPALVYGSLLIYRHIRTPAGATDNAALVQEVGKSIQLPEGETPTIATITDLAPLANQEFFKDAAVGDKVLIYSKAGQAVLYRPTTNKVIAVGPLDTNSAANTATQ